MKTTTASGSFVRAPVRQHGGTFAFATIMVSTIGTNGTTVREPVDLIFPDPFAERILAYAKPGMNILVNGRENLKTFLKRDKVPDKINEIFVTSMEFGPDQP